MIKTIRNIIILFCVIVLIIFCIFKIETKLDRIKIENKLVETSVVHNAPPLIAFTTVALGGFRGVIADILWLKTMLLQTQGKYFEMMQLASWISKLQPGFTGTTTFLAWNMAYNISITFNAPNDKWRWVENGIKILKNAITDTPNKPDLYAETAWLYLHKIGTPLDSSNLYYKNELTKSMYNDLEIWKPNWLLLKETPNSYNKLKTILSQKFNIQNLYMNTRYNESKLISYFKTYHKLPKEILRNINYNPQIIKLIKSYFVKQLLWDNFNLKPANILKTNNTFGNLDWYLWQAHALYWLYNVPDNSLLNNKKFISFLFIALYQTLANGNLLLFDSSNINTFYTGPNIEIIPKTQKLLYSYTLKSKYKNIYKRRYKNFMKDSILYLYIMGKKEEAHKYFKLIQTQFPENKDYSKKFNDFLEAQIFNKFDLTSYYQTLEAVKHFTKLSFIYKAKNNLLTSKSLIVFSKILYTTYNLNNNRKLPPFQTLEKSINLKQINRFLINKN